MISSFTLIQTTFEIGSKVSIGVKCIIEPSARPFLPQLTILLTSSIINLCRWFFDFFSRECFIYSKSILHMLTPSSLPYRSFLYLFAHMLEDKHLSPNNSRNKNIQVILRIRFSKSVLQRNLKETLRCFSILIPLNLRVNWVVRRNVRGPYFVPVSFHLHSNRISGHVIGSILFLIGHVQRIHITQKILALILQAALLQSTVLNCNYFFQIFVFRNQIIWYRSPWFSFHPLHACFTFPCSKNSHSLGSSIFSILIIYTARPSPLYNRTRCSDFQVQPESCTPPTHS